MTNEKDKALILSAAESAIKRLDKAVEVKTGTLDLRGGNQREGFRIWLEDAMMGVLTAIRKEERETVWQEAVRVVGAKADALRQTEPFGTGVISASVQILEAIEAAATKQGEE